MPTKEEDCSGLGIFYSKDSESWFSWKVRIPSSGMLWQPHRMQRVDPGQFPLTVLLVSLSPVVQTGLYWSCMLTCAHRSQSPQDIPGAVLTGQASQVNVYRAPGTSWRDRLRMAKCPSSQRSRDVDGRTVRSETACP